MSRFVYNVSFTFLLLIALSVSFAEGQFHGGKEDGVDIGINIGSDLSGKISHFSIIYFGYFGEGSDYKSYSSVMNGKKISIYAGGNDEGSFNKLNTYSLTGGNLSILYLGNVDDGSAIAFASQSPSGLNSTSIYNGGMNEGHTLTAYSNLLEAQFPFSMYLGGRDEGHTTNSGSAAVASPGIQLYSGGYDEGSEQLKYTGPLDLSAQNLLFLGGNDDGFTLILESALLLTGGTTFVERNLINEITLYPNPLTGNELYIRFENEFSYSNIENLTLHSLNGMQHPIRYSLADKNIKITLQNSLRSGTYILKVYTNMGETYAIRFIAQ